MAPYSSTLAWRTHGQRSLVGYSPYVCTESDMTEATKHTQLIWAECMSLRFMHPNPMD